MIKHICTIFLFLISCVSAHTTDTLFVDTSFVSGDSLRIVKIDTTLVTDSLRTLQKIYPDTLVPITVGILSGESTIIGKKTFLFTPYRYTGDLLRPFSLSFIKDLGFIGQPHETFIYGVGDRGISFLQDGVLWNNRYSNSLDLNLVQSEDIDSIEIVPSPRGFLYGPYNNPVAVNFIMRDFLSPQPYTRIRYYEGPNGEAMIDGKFNAQIAKRWNLSFQVTNRSVDETYKNTDLSIWQANAKLKYLLSNSVNISSSYYFVSSNQGLNGGVDYDSLSQISNNPNTDLYDPAIAPVLYPNRTLDVTQHNFSLRTLAKPFDNAKLDLSLYYKYSLDEFRNENDTSSYKQNWDNKIIGGRFKYEQKSQFLNLELFATYEKNRSSTLQENYYFPSTLEMNDVHYSIGGILSGNLISGLIVPSIFYKYENKNFGKGKTLASPGYGFDVKISPIESLNFYTGLSSYDQIRNNTVNLFEIGGTFLINNLRLDLKYFNIDKFVPYDPDLWSLILSGAEIGYPIFSARGIGFSGGYKFWLFLVDANCSYYFDEIVNLPEYQFIGGFYLKSKLFDNNLDLKSGFTFYYTGKRSPFINPEVEASNKIDFILIGEILERAIVYFVWENLFDNQYFITPYYPMPESSIRFGLSWELFN